MLFVEFTHLALRYIDLSLSFILLKISTWFIRLWFPSFSPFLWSFLVLALTGFLLLPVDATFLVAHSVGSFLFSFTEGLCVPIAPGHVLG